MIQEYLSEKAITLWGPFAFCIILLLAIVYILWNQYLLRQKTYEEREEKRTNMFVEATQRFTEVISQNSEAFMQNKNSIDQLNNNVGLNTAVLHDVHITVTRMNERM